MPKANKHPGHLNHTDFLTVVKNTPLVAIDLIVYNPDGEILIGYRKNRPAQNTWFVPGGKIFKDERIAEAIERISLAEIGLSLNLKDCHFKGVYEHLYADNFAGEPGISTHYIVLAYESHLTSTPPPLPVEQHSDFRWVSPTEILAEPGIHPNTKAYFS